MRNQFTTKLVSGILLRNSPTVGDHLIESNQSSLANQASLWLSHTQILLGLRQNTQQFNQHWSLPIGHVQPEESDEQAIKRELKEELSIDLINASKFQVKTDQQLSIYHQVYWVEQWAGKIINAEPHLCAQLHWFYLHQLPQPITPISLEIIHDINKNNLPNNLLFKQQGHKDD